MKYSLKVFKMSVAKPQILNCHSPSNTSLCNSPNQDRRSEHTEQRAQEMSRGEDQVGTKLPR